MLPPFVFQAPTRIVFGAGALRDLADEIGRLERRRGAILLVADQGVARAGLVERAREVLSAAGLEVMIDDGLAGEPSGAEIDRLAMAARRSGAAAVVALGGGSALDAGKLAAALAPGEAPAEAYALAARALPPDPVPLVCIPTTAGTGAEVTRTAVFTDAAGQKVWAWGEALQPRVALLDPTLTTFLPAGITATSGLDALVHAIEAATSRRAQPVADALALHAIRLLTTHLPTVLARPRDLAARAAMMHGACLAGLAIDAVGTGVAHALGHALGSIARVPHGRAVALAMRATLAWNSMGAPERHRAAGAAMGLAPGLDVADLGAALETRFAALVRGAGLEVSLVGDGLGPSDAGRLIDALFAEANRPMIEANARAVGREAAARLCARLLDPA